MSAAELDMRIDNEKIKISSVSPSAIVVAIGRRETTLGWSTLRAAARQEDDVLRSVYGALLDAAERLLLGRLRAVANRRVEACAGHRAVTSRDRAFFGPVSSHDENRAAHGGICVHETCGCGAERRRNLNQGHEEIGGWYAPYRTMREVRDAIDVACDEVSR